jgi:hypothetical protein
MSYTVTQRWGLGIAAGAVQMLATAKGATGHYQATITKEAFVNREH